MILTLRTKLLIGVMPLLAVVVGLGLWAITLFSRLGNNIDVILRENYRSVLAAQGMKEALERMDSAQWFAIGGEEGPARSQYRANRDEFAKKLRVEQSNVTLPGEQEMADDLAALDARYVVLADRFFALPPGDREGRTRFYFREILPTFDAIRRRADDVREINQRNMEDENNRARATAGTSSRLMLIGMVGAVAVASAIAAVMSRAILGPIRAVTIGARAMAAGDLDQVVPATTRDELGELASAFNVMARTIREYRQAGTARLIRARRTAQATIDSFPDPVIVVDPAGLVERANPAARRILGVAPSDDPVPWSPPAQVRGPLAEVLGGQVDRPPIGLEQALIYRDDGQERSFLPHVLAILDEDRAPLGAAVVFTEVTRFRLLDQLKSDMVSTVSHELKTPLTGVQMTVHLLLEEVVGPLNAKQVELLLGARQDSDRLLAIIDDLLDLTRIEQGRVRLDRRPEAPADLVAGAIDRAASRAGDAGVGLRGAVTFGLPPAAVDRERIEHVFDNLIGNALAHTPKGGSVKLSAEARGDSLAFAVEDTGEGIAPEHLARIFEKFYRVPGSKSTGGAGLGLAIAREIVEAHGGQVEARSEPGRGTTFTFTLPAEVGNPPPFAT